MAISRGVLPLCMENSSAAIAPRQGERPATRARRPYDRFASQGLTYDDVLLVPAYSEVLPREVDAALKAGLKSWRIDRALPPGTMLTDAVGVTVAADFALVDKWLSAAVTPSARRAGADGL